MNLSTEQKLGIVTLAMILAGTVAVEVLEKSYYCLTEDNVKECIRLSSSGITCYYLGAEDITKGDRCTGGKWELLEKHLPEETKCPSCPECPQIICPECEPCPQLSCPSCPEITCPSYIKEVQEGFKIRANNKEWICSIKQGRVTQHTPCYSDDKTGYLGEFI